MSAPQSQIARAHFSATLPLRTGRGLNDRKHHFARYRAAKAERKAAYLCTRAVSLPCVVTLTRISPGTLDGDNLQGALKGVRDGVADRLGVDDRDARVRWVYAQERGKEFGVRIVIEATTATDGPNAGDADGPQARST